MAEMYKTLLEHLRARRENANARLELEEHRVPRDFNLVCRVRNELHDIEKQERETICAMQERAAATRDDDDE